MTTMMSIEIDVAVAEAVREKAQKTGKTPEKMLGEMVTEQFHKPRSNDWIDKVLESSRKSTANSGGKKFNREELYDR